MTNDLALLRRYHEHADAFAFRELVQVHAGMVFATARRVTRDPALAEDISQETFLELARHASTVRESVGAWLHRVAWRRACNAVRDASARRRYEAAAEPEAPVHEQPEATWAELEPLIDAALEELPDKLRAPLVEHFLEGRTQQEIAARLGLNQSTVSRLLNNGVEELRTHLRGRGAIAGGALVALLTANLITPAPAALVTSLGKLAVSGVAASAAGATAARLAWLKGWRLAALTTAAIAVVLGAWFLLRNPPPANDPANPLARWEPTTTPPAQDLEGRAFCPVCAGQTVAGRRVEQGIFVHQTNGRETVYHLELAQPLPNFHQQLCIPSMTDPQAVKARGSIQKRGEHLILAAVTLTPRAR